MSDLVDPSTILKKLSKPMLQAIYDREHPEDESNLTRVSMIEKINETIEETGVTSLLEFMKREDLKELINKLDINWKDEDNKNSKAVLSSRLREKIMPSGIDEFLQDVADVSMLNKLCDSLEESPVSTNKDQLVKQVSGAVRGLGAETFWNSFDVTTLQNVTNDLKLKTKGTNSKRKLVDSIITNSNPEKNEPKKKKRKITYSKKKKPIEKGISYDDIFQHYYVAEVRSWCKAHDLKTSGKKKVLINRILGYLNEDAEDGDSGKESKDKKENSD